MLLYYNDLYTSFHNNGEHNSLLGSICATEITTKTPILMIDIKGIEHVAKDLNINKYIRIESLSYLRY